MAAMFYMENVNNEVISHKQVDIMENCKISKKFTFFSIALDLAKEFNTNIILIIFSLGFFRSRKFI